LAVTFLLKTPASPLSNKTGLKKLKVSDIAYSTGMFGKNTVHVLRPKIDKISITYDIQNAQDQEGVNNLLAQAVIDGTCPEYESATYSKGKAWGYKTSVHLKHPDTNERILIQATPNKKQNRFMRFEFNPTKLGKAGMQFFREELDGLFGGHYSYSNVITEGHITRVDIASDFVGITMNDILVRSVKPGITMAFLGKAGVLESVYPSKPPKGEKSPNKVYDKKQEQWGKANTLEFGGISHLRAEISVETDLRVPDLHKLKNHFTKLDIIARAAITPPEEEHHWRFFFDSCRVRGVKGALDQLPDHLKEPYATALRDAGKAFWRPEKIWSYWPKEFKKSNLLDGL